MTNKATGNEKAAALTGVGRDEDGSADMDRYQDSEMTIDRARPRRTPAKLLLALAAVLVLVTALAPVAEAGTTRLYEGPLGSSSGAGSTGLVAVDQSNGDIYVARIKTSPNIITRYDSSGVAKNFTAGPSAGTNTLIIDGEVAGIAVDGSGGPLDGSLYVSERSDIDEVLRAFDRTGQSRGSVTGASTPRGSFNEPSAIAVDQSDGSLYIVSRENFDIKIWRYAPNSPSGTVDDADYVVTGVSGVEAPDPSITAGMGVVYLAGGVRFEGEGNKVQRIETSAFAPSVPKASTIPLESESKPVRARAVAVDQKTGELYAVDHNDVAVFSPDGALLYRFGAAAYFSEQPEGLAVKSAISGPAEKVYVSEAVSKSKEVAVFGPVTNSVVRTRFPLGVFGKDGSASSAFNDGPTLAFRSSPVALFALDRLFPGIYGFDATAPPAFPGLPAFSPLSTPAVDFQSSLAVDNTALSSADNVYVVAGGTDKLYGFDASGVPLAGFPVDPTATPGAPMGSPVDLRGAAVDSEGHVWVVNAATKRVLEYSSTGTYLSAVDASAHGALRWIAFDSNDNMFISTNAFGVWKYPAPSYASPLQVDSQEREQTGIAVDPTTDDLYVAYANRLDIFNASGSLIEEIGSVERNKQVFSGIAVDPATKNLYLTDAVPRQIRVLGPPLILPELALGAASDLGDTTATLNGRVGAQGVPIEDCQFEYVSEDAFRLTGFDDLDSGGSASCGSVPTDLENHTVSALVSGLVPSTNYRFRIVAANENGTVSTPDASFTTPGPPLAETTGSPLRTTTTARLEGRISPSSAPASFHFEYGESPCDANTCISTEPVSAGSGNVYRLASTQVSGLQPNTTYHYRIVAENDQPGSPVYGEDMMVTTRSSDAPLSHGHLPGPPGSDRAYEQVTLSDTGGNPVNAGVSFSDNGDRAIYFTSGGSPSSPVGGFRSQYFAERHETAPHTGSWQSSAVMPPREELVGPLFNPPSGPSDLSSFTVDNFAVSSSIRSIWRLSPSSPARKLFEPTPPQEYGNWYVGSDDSTRVVAVLRGGTLDPNYPSAAALDNLYDISSGTPKLASVLPGETVSPCGLPGEVNRFGLEGEGGQSTRNWLSADGELLFFQIGCGIPNLYVRDLEAEETKLISGPQLSGQDCGGILIKSIPGAAFFWTQSRLTGDDTNPASCTTAATGPDGDVYRYELSSGALECLTCPDGDVFEGSGNAESIMRGIAVADDGSRVYFQSPNRLVPGAPTLPEGSSSGSLYRLEVATGDLRWIAGPGATVGEEAISRTAINPDGSTIVFGSNDPSFNQLGDGTDNGGTVQYYLYDDTDRSLVCVSCPPDGSAAKRDVPERLLSTFQSIGANTTPMADDGTFAFHSTEALVGADQNTAGAGQEPRSGTDIYEWRDGRLLLITDGLTNWPSGEVPALNGVSPSGLDVFFTAPIQYTQDALGEIGETPHAALGVGSPGR